MIYPMRRLARRLPALVGLCFVLSSGALSRLSGQELPLKRAIPRPGTVTCPQVAAPTPPGDEERAQAGRLASSADQALILGDQERARDLLARAVELDPSSGELAYRYARILDDLGDRSGAMDQYCRAMALSPAGEETRDARGRLEALAALDRPSIPDEAVVAFQSGLVAADAGRLLDAEQAFTTAFQLAPEWTDALLNRGVVRSRLGRVGPAVSDLQEYLALRPDAPDAIMVSQRIGQLQATAPLPSPGAALGLGIVLPGLGQFYSGRTVGGFTVMALAGGAAAAGFLVKEVKVRCVGSSPSGDTCPPDRIIGESTDHPYVVPGLAAAAAIGFIGAVEAYVRAKRRVNETADQGMALELGALTVAGPSLSARGSLMSLNLVRVRF